MAALRPPMPNVDEQLNYCTGYVKSYVPQMQAIVAQLKDAAANKRALDSDVQPRFNLLRRVGEENIRAGESLITNGLLPLGRQKAEEMSRNIFNATGAHLEKLLEQANLPKDAREFINARKAFYMTIAQYDIAIKAPKLSWQKAGTGFTGQKLTYEWLMANPVTKVRIERGENDPTLDPQKPLDYLIGRQTNYAREHAEFGLYQSYDEKKNIFYSRERDEQGANPAWFKEGRNITVKGIELRDVNVGKELVIDGKKVKVTDINRTASIADWVRITGDNGKIYTLQQRQAGQIIARERDYTVPQENVPFIKQYEKILGTGDNERVFYNALDQSGKYVAFRAVIRAKQVGDTDISKYLVDSTTLTVAQAQKLKAQPYSQAVAAELITANEAAIKAGKTPILFYTPIEGGKAIANKGDPYSTRRSVLMLNKLGATLPTTGKEEDYTAWLASQIASRTPKQKGTTPEQVKADAGAKANEIMSALKANAFKGIPLEYSLPLAARESRRWYDTLAKEGAKGLHAKYWKAGEIQAYVPAALLVQETPALAQIRGIAMPELALRGVVRMQEVAGKQLPMSLIYSEAATRVFAPAAGYSSIADNITDLGMSSDFINCFPLGGLPDYSRAANILNQAIAGGYYTDVTIYAPGTTTVLHEAGDPWTAEEMAKVVFAGINNPFQYVENFALGGEASMRILQTGRYEMRAFAGFNATTGSFILMGAEKEKVGELQRIAGYYGIDNIVTLGPKDLAALRFAVNPVGYDSDQIKKLINEAENGDIVSTLIGELTDKNRSVAYSIEGGYMHSLSKDVSVWAKARTNLNRIEKAKFEVKWGAETGASVRIWGPFSAQLTEQWQQGKKPITSGGVGIDFGRGITAGVGVRYDINQPSKYWVPQVGISVRLDDLFKGKKKEAGVLPGTASQSEVARKEAVQARTGYANKLFSGGENGLSPVSAKTISFYVNDYAETPSGTSVWLKVPDIIPASEYNKMNDKQKAKVNGILDGRGYSLAIESGRVMLKHKFADEGAKKLAEQQQRIAPYATGERELMGIKILDDAFIALNGAKLGTFQPAQPQGKAEPLFTAFLRSAYFKEADGSTRFDKAVFDKVIGEFGDRALKVDDFITRYGYLYSTANKGMITRAQVEEIAKTTKVGMSPTSASYLLAEYDRISGGAEKISFKDFSKALKNHQTNITDFLLAAAKYSAGEIGGKFPVIRAGKTVLDGGISGEEMTRYIEDYSPKGKPVEAANAVPVQAAMAPTRVAGAERRTGTYVQTAQLLVSPVKEGKAMEISCGVQLAAGAVVNSAYYRITEPNGNKAAFSAYTDGKWRKYTLTPKMAGTYNVELEIITSMPGIKGTQKASTSTEVTVGGRRAAKTVTTTQAPQPAVTTTTVTPSAPAPAVAKAGPTPTLEQRLQMGLQPGIGAPSKFNFKATPTKSDSGVAPVAVVADTSLVTETNWLMLPKPRGAEKPGERKELAKVTVGGEKGVSRITILMENAQGDIKTGTVKSATLKILRPDGKEAVVNMAVGTEKTGKSFATANYTPSAQGTYQTTAVVEYTSTDTRTSRIFEENFDFRVSKKK